jgi:hypothetical protein
MLQNKFILGTVSALIISFGVLFVMQPSTAHAEANVWMRPEHGEVVIFGNVDLTNGKPLKGMKLEVGQSRQLLGLQGQGGGNPNSFRTLDSTRTDWNGQFKLWVTNQEAHKLMGHNLTLVLQPTSHISYDQKLPVRAGDVASVSIAMRTPLIPVLPFVTFVY